MKMAVLTKTLGIVQRVTFTDYRLTKILCAVYIKQKNLENPHAHCTRVFFNKYCITLCYI